MNANTRWARSAALTLAVAGALSAAAAKAEEQNGTGLEEVVVTAERRPQSLQDVPASATVITAAALEAQGVKNVIDIQQVAPSVAINTYNRGTFINIRGIGIAQSAPTSSPGVAYYIDGVYIPHETFISQSFYDLDSVEVLRGPQGTLTGQNSTGGAVYVRTPEPSFAGFSGYVDQTVADYNWHKTVVALNAPFGDKVAVRIAGVYDKHDSFTTNIGPSDTEPGSGELKGARIDVLLKPIDTLSFDLRYEHFDYLTGYNAIKNRNDAVTRDPFVIEEDAISYLNQHGYRTSAEMKWDISSTLQLRAISSLAKALNKDQADGDRTATALPQPPTTNTGRVGYTRQAFDSRAHELDLISNGEQVQWVVGAFYFNETTPVQVLRDNRHTVTLVQSNSTILAEAENKSKSAFGQVDWKFASMLALTAGVRYSKDSQDYTRTALPGPPPPGCFPCINTAESNKTTGRVGLKFFATDNTMAYITYSRGYKAGGVNLDPRTGVFDPETNDVVELGVKSTVLDDRLRINGDVFYSNYKDIQLSGLLNGLPATLNAGKNKIYGAELEITGQFDALGLNAGLSWLPHAATEENQILVNTDTNGLAPVASGTRLPFSPKVTATAGVQYKFNVGTDMSLTPRMQYAYLGEQFATMFESATTRVPGHGVADVRLLFNPTKQLTLEGFATNVFDKTYIAVQVQNASSAAGGWLLGAPRQYGFRAKYAF